MVQCNGGWNNSTKFLIILALTIGSCSKTSRLDSNDFSTAEERIEILKQKVRCFSPVKDAEFELFNVDEPGWYSLDYKVAIKVDTADIAKWREGMTKFDREHYDDAWIKEIVKNRKENWKTNSQPLYYTRDEHFDGWYTILVEFYSEGMIFMQVRHSN